MLKKYRILLTNHALEEFRGSETYCYTLAKELSLSNNVFVYSPRPGMVAEKMKEFAEILKEPSGDYDIILFNHNNTIHEAFNAKCKIYTIHGIFPVLEKPPTGMDLYVAISQEIANHYKSINPVVIYNGIDTEKYKPNNKNTKSKSNLLYSSNAKGNFSLILYLASKSLGLNYRRIGRKKSKRTNVIEDIAWSDIVVGLGRTALEGLSSNKKVIIADKRFYNKVGMDGLLTAENVENIKKFNYSGRALRKVITFFSLRNEIRKAINDDSTWEREWIMANHDIQKIADEYISLAEQIMTK
jgi:glycosyltransferase involved in cell wall biosynthesis